MNFYNKKYEEINIKKKKHIKISHLSVKNLMNRDFASNALSVNNSKKSTGLNRHLAARIASANRTRLAVSSNSQTMTASSPWRKSRAANSQ